MYAIGNFATNILTLSTPANTRVKVACECNGLSVVPRLLPESLKNTTYVLYVCMCITAVGYRNCLQLFHAPRPHPASYYESPAILFKRKSAVPMDSEDEGQASDPAASSLVLQTPCKDPVGLSPIDCRSEGTQPEMNETCDQEPFPVTPCKAAPSSPILSPIVRGAKAGVLPVASPMVVGKPLVGSSGKTTSTPNTAGTGCQVKVQRLAPYSLMLTWPGGMSTLPPLCVY